MLLVALISIVIFISTQPVLCHLHLKFVPKLSNSFLRGSLC